MVNFMLSVFYHNRKPHKYIKGKKKKFFFFVLHYPDDIKIKEFWPKDITDRGNRQVSECEDMAGSEIAELRTYRKRADKQQQKDSRPPKEKGQRM